MRKEVGIDFGATELRVSVPGSGIVLRSPSVVAVDRMSKKQLRFGVAAQKMAADDSSVSLNHPFRRGLFSDPELAKRVLAWCLNSTFPEEDDVRALFAIPCSLSDEEEGALVEMIASAGFGEAYLLYSPVAALIGCGYSLEKTYLSVNIGSNTTDIVVLAEGEIIERLSIPTGGDAFCEAVAAYIAKKHHVRINFRTAEEVKRSIGTVWLDGERSQTEVTGRGVSDAWQHTLVSSEEMFTALEEPCASILEAICNAAAKIPLDHVGAALERGILLSGGGAYLSGMRQMIEGITGFSCRVPDHSADVVAMGLAAVLPELPKIMHGRNASIVAVKSFSFRD